MEHELTGLFAIVQRVFVETGNGGVRAAIGARWPPQRIQANEHVLVTAVRGRCETGAVDE